MTTTAVAERVGYLSEAAFSRTFKKFVGKGPGAYRRVSSPK
jgi:AraC-like DNA-binding protein